MFDKRPFVDGKKVLCSGVIKPYGGQCVDVKSPIVDQNTKKKSVIGRMAQFTTNDVMEVLHSSKVAWNDGLGEWPQMTANERVKSLEGFIGTLKQSRDDIIHILMWEIGKSFDDSQSEFDRTVKFMQDSICEYKCLLDKDGQLKEEEGYLLQTKRGPVGVVLSIAPYNYPLDEAYTSRSRSVPSASTASATRPPSWSSCTSPWSTTSCPS
jgi:glyceraldehyde-3-phosphate dehydrogenase (NADP+)